ncbi:MAG: HAD hydrolase family protein, partial [Oribacterium sp.]|nr:HAD hydrolase family protein [Oribacterium sp.]
MKYKMIALDLDGTLTNSKKEVSERNREALKKAADKGVHIVLASG